ncbi:MAG: hypothetical protein P8M22_10340 [Phycisphaerales bacterium]|nr:hypothetical protein [Phycisphaerales bacterium]
MGQTGKSKKQAANKANPLKRAAPVTVASGKRRQPEPAPAVNSPLTTSAGSSNGRIVIAITLVALAVPVIISVIMISRTIPAQSSPDLFTPWWAYLISFGVIAATWCFYIVWARKTT